MPPRITPGITLRPWKQPWQVCFVPCWQHWTMRPFRMPPPFQHIFLLRPYESIHIGPSRWLYTEWSFMGAVTVLIDEHHARPCTAACSPKAPCCTGAATPACRRSRMGNGLWPLTCVTYARQVLGLPFRYLPWTPKGLWDELVDKGATVVVDPAERDKVGYTIGRKDPRP